MPPGGRGEGGMMPRLAAAQCRSPSAWTLFRQGLTLVLGMCLGSLLTGLVTDYDDRPTERQTQGPTDRLTGPSTQWPKQTEDWPGQLFDPVKVPRKCPKSQRRKVVDVTLVNNELSTLELRLNELWDVVDVFVVAESRVPFKPGAPPKPLHLEERWGDFAKFHSKMVRYEIPEEVSRGTGAKVNLTHWSPNFKVQWAQRRDLWRYLGEDLHTGDNDLVVRADLDEIPRPKVIEDMACAVGAALPKTPICLSTKDGFYYYNYKCHIKNEWKDNPRILRYGDNYRPSYFEAGCQTRLPDASTHCSSCFGSMEEYRIKSISNSEPIRYPKKQNDEASILDRVRSCKDFWLRGVLDETMELRPSVDMEKIPTIVSRHPGRWPHLMGKGPLYDESWMPERKAIAPNGNTSSIRAPTKNAVPEQTATISNNATINASNGDGVRKPICRTPQNYCVHPYFPNPSRTACPPQDKLEMTPTGSWILPKNFAYNFDQKLADAILGEVVSGSVLELGAGLGCYLTYFRDSHMLTKVVGYEGAANVRERSGGLVEHVDLAETRHDFGKFDWVVCLEVAEHIPSEFELTFIENVLAASPKGIVLSWALSDQPGSGHVNGRTNEYVISLMKREGYEFEPAGAAILRTAAGFDWFKRTTMVFKAK